MLDTSIPLDQWTIGQLEELTLDELRELARAAGLQLIDV